MGSATVLAGRTILVVEDHPLIRLELTSLFESVGAQVIATHTREQAVIAVEQYRIGAALLDYGLREDNVAPLCGLLARCRIHLEQSYPGIIVVQKPASAEVLVATMANLTGGPLARSDFNRPLAA